MFKLYFKSDIGTRKELGVFETEDDAVEASSIYAIGQGFFPTSITFGRYKDTYKINYGKKCGVFTVKEVK